MMTATLLLFAATFVLAQPGRGQRGPKQADLYSELGLTAQQQEQIKTIRTEARAKFKPADAAAGARPDREAMHKAKQETAQAIDAVLTPAQREQLTKLKAERKAAMESVDQKAIRSDLKAHHANEVQPVLKAARGQLDQFISAEDKVAIERLRGVFTTKPGHQQMKEAGREGQPRQRPTEEEMAARKAEGKAWQDAHAADIAELKSLTTKYQADLDRIQQRLQPQMDEWAREKQEIVKSHLPEDASQRAGKKPAGKDAHQGKGKKQREQRKGWPRSSAFLLMKG